MHRVAPVLARNDSSLRIIWRALVCLTCLVAGRAASGGAPGQQDLSDLLVVFPTFHKRIGVVEASRAWRMGVSTHIVVDDLVSGFERWGWPLGPGHGAQLPSARRVQLSTAKTWRGNAHTVAGGRAAPLILGGT